LSSAKDFWDALTGSKPAVVEDERPVKGVARPAADPLRDYRNALQAAMEKPEPRKEFTGDARIAELQTAIESAQQAVTERDSTLEAQRSRLDQLHALQTEILLTADDPTLRELDTAIRIGEQRANAMRRLQQDQQAELAKMQQEVEDLFAEKSAVAEFNTVSAWLNEAKSGVAEGVETICQALRRLREISTSAAYGEQWNGLSPANRKRLRDQYSGFQYDLVKFVELRIFQGVLNTTSPERVGEHLLDFLQRRDW